MTNPDDPAVKTALQTRCGLGTCGALPGKPCRFKGKPLQNGQLVHFYRIGE